MGCSSGQKAQLEELSALTHAPSVHMHAHARAHTHIQVLGKRLTEQLVKESHGAPFPCAIVRPSLISAIAGAPYPGYVGNLSGELSPPPPPPPHTHTHTTVLRRVDCVPMMRVPGSPQRDNA